MGAAESLGMMAQEVFAKKDKKGAKKSTHLVCSEPSGTDGQAKHCYQSYLDIAQTGTVGCDRKNSVTLEMAQPRKTDFNWI